MLRKLRPRSVYDVLAALSFFLLLGGTAWAVAANSVGTVQLKNRAVTNPKLASNAVGTGKVVDHSLLAKDFKAGQLAPLQFDVQVPEGTGTAVGPTVNGVYIRADCISGGGDPTVLEVYLFPAGGEADSVGVSGFGEEGGPVTGITAQSQAHYELISKSVKTGGISGNWDVLARDVHHINKWTHFVIGAYNPGKGNGCGVWGNVSPTAN